MKKVLLFLILMFSVSFLFACTLPSIDDENKDDETEENGNENGNEKEDDTTSVKEDYDSSQIENKLDALRQKDGYFIKYEYQDDEEPTIIAFGAKGDLFYLISNGEEAIFDLSHEDHMDNYTKTDDEWSLSTIEYKDGLTKEYAQAIVDSYSALANSLCTMYEVITDDNFVKSSATIAGRACDQYTTLVTAGVFIKYTVCVDKETGACLKWLVEGTTDAGRVSATFECTQFATSYNIELPEVEEPADE